MYESNYDEQTANTIKIGVSACLLGREVRFDGGHKRSRFVTDALAGHFEFVAFCPEVAIGMGYPTATDSAGRRCPEPGSGRCERSGAECKPAA